ncbi:DUF427 domain-containing protein [uncultured Jatrophihabitans sp.]|uniref:DUF427 domain-containing protein n=1 Tax=uncultured Jatrophihabitans sp. TaxID=1610747 RepID=UPI0035CC8B4D
MANQQLIPGPDHPITVQPHAGRVTVRLGDTVVADTTAALELQESTYPVAYYLPIADVDRAMLRDSGTTTYCPYKGTASYYSVAVGEQVVDDVIWFYPQPYDAVADIVEHVAFYPNKVEIAA